MGLEHVTRATERYFIHGGTTKTGKPRFWASKKSGPSVVDSLPPEFEIREAPDTAIVTVRRKLVTRILPHERKTVEAIADDVVGICVVDVEKDAIVVYTPNRTVEELRKDFPEIRAAAAESWVRGGQFHQQFRFDLADESSRAFRVSRWCYRGRIDGWISLSGAARLGDLARKYLPHAMKESFFDLM